MWNDTDKSMYGKECKLFVRFNYKMVIDDSTKVSLSKMNWSLRGSVKAEIETSVHSRRLIALRKYVRIGFLEALSGKNREKARLINRLILSKIWDFLTRVTIKEKCI